MKYINVTPEMIEELAAILKEQLTNAKALADKVTVSLPIKLKAKPEEKPTVYISTVAEHKIKALVDMANTEVAWHGTVSRDKDSNSYYIEDIFVFPQEVTGTTADATDDYTAWLMEEIDNDTFNKLRFHGHSHVNMGTSPSSTDKAYQENMLSPIKDFYIFAIYNKKSKYDMWIYDVEGNTMYETEDIICLSELTEVFDWAAQEIDEKVITKKSTSYVGFGTRAATSVTAANKGKGKGKGKEEKPLSVYEKTQRELRPELYGPPTYDWRTDYGYGGFNNNY